MVLENCGGGLITTPTGKLEVMVIRNSKDGRAPRKYGARLQDVLKNGIQILCACSTDK